MVILVDTSVWIDFLRGGTRSGSLMLRDPNVVQHIVVGDLIMLEVLQGARNEADAMKLRGVLEDFPMVDLLGQSVAIRASRHFRTLRAVGVTMRKTADLIIGTWCIANGAQLLHHDRDFDAMETHLGLAVA